MGQPWKYATVEFVLGAGDLLNVAIAGWATAGGTIPQAGLTQNDAVQFVTDLAALRHAATCGAVGEFAIFRGGKWVRNVWSLGFPDLSDGESSVPIVGSERLSTASPGGGELGPHWGRDLALAMDQIMAELADARQAGEPPSGFGPVGIVVPAAAPAVVAIIVGGVALGVIGTAAAWRYLDPELRTRAAEVRAAAKAFEGRLRVLRDTGTMPPPSELEKANAEAVRETASTRRNRDWAYAAAAVGGLAVGTMGVAWIRGLAAE